MIVYPYKNSLYLNITNRCPCSCVYCIKFKWSWKFRGHDLKLQNEPSVQDIIKEVKKHGRASEVVFCGYGEPFMRFDVLKESSKLLHQEGYRVRINTTGVGNLINKRDVLPELRGFVDGISVSLNAATPEEYQKINRSIYGETAFNAVIEFIKKAKEIIPEVTITSIDFREADIDKIKNIAAELGVAFRRRPYLDDYENR